jgi:hypothetical protein
VTDRQYPDDEELPRDTAPEALESEEREAEGRAKRDGPLQRTVSVATGAARGSASVAAGAARGSAAVADAALHITYWPAALCVLAAIALQVRLTDKVTVGPTWLLPALEGVLLLGLAATTPWGRPDVERPFRRHIAIGLIAFVNLGNAVDLGLLVHELLHKHIGSGRALVLSGLAIWLTNVLIFALWYWELDRGGPANRARHGDPTTPEGHPDFVFPEMDTGKEYTPAGWMPSFIDYLALAVTTATAFSPTDTMPNSRRAKVLMSAQGLISLVTLGLIISRAVGILG